MKQPIALAALPLLFVAGVAAQQPASPASQPAQPAPRPGTTAQQPATTLTGCLYRENQIPGRTPNVAEKAGVMEDYILAGASVGGSDAKPSATPGATGTSGTAPSTGKTYKIEGPADEKLKALVGKRVEVTGRIDPQGGPGTSNPSGAATPDRGPGPDKINLPEFEASAIREVSGTCPATPPSPQ
jgi:hypothetical protein